MDYKNYVVKKINESDILEILLEYFPEINDKNTPSSRGALLGKPGDNLRFIGVYGKEKDSNDLKDLSFEDIDSKYDFNGDHGFIEGNPEFWMSRREATEALQKHTKPTRHNRLW